MAAMVRHRGRLYTGGGILAIALVSLASCGGSGGVVDGGTRHLQRITFPAGIRGYSPRYSPDGTMLAYARDTGVPLDAGTNVFELAVMTAAGTDSHSIVSDGNNLLSMAWTPDGSALMYGAADTTLRKAQLSGGPSQFLLDTPDALDPDVSPDGRWLAYGLYDGHVQLVDLSQDPPLRSDLGFSANSPRFSPDGATLAVVTFPKIRLFDLASRMFTDVIDTNNPLGRVDWFPDGVRLVAGTERGIEIITLGPQVQRRTIGGDAGSSPTRTRDVDLSPDAKSVAYSVEGDAKIYVLTGF